MAEEKRQVSDLVAQGWEVAGFSSAHNGTEFTHTMLMRRQRQHKIVVVKKRWFKAGTSVEEIDV